MGFQFIREECYARVRSQGAPSRAGNKPIASGKRSAREIIAEVIRQPGAAPHVEAVKSPQVLYGLQIDELPLWMDQIEAMALEIKVSTRNGERRQRSDTPILLGVVASFPGPANEQDPLYILWRERTLDFFKVRYGSSLISVIEHTDEKYGHLHAEITNRGMSVKNLHAGHFALQEVLKKGGSKKAQSEAYKKGTRALQDAFYDAVSMEVGLARIGPRKRRKTRAEWQAEKHFNLATARSIAQEKKRAENAAIVACNAAVMLEKAERRMRQAVEHGNKIKNDEAHIRAEINTQREELRNLAEVLYRKEKVVDSTLVNADISRLCKENEQLRYYINQLSGLALAEQESQYPETHSVAPRLGICRKP